MLECQQAAVAERLRVDRVATVSAHEHHRFGECLPGLGDLDDFLIALGRHPEELEHALAHKEKALRALALGKEHFASAESDFVYGFQQPVQLIVRHAGK